MTTIVRRAFSHSSLRIVITATIVILLTLTAGVTWFFTFRNGQVSIRELASQVGRQSMANIRALETYVSTASMQKNDLNSFAFGLGDVTDVSTDRWRRFRAEIDRFENVTSVGYSDEQRESVAVGRGIMGFPLAIALSGQGTGYYFDAYALDERGSRGELFYHPSRHMTPACGRGIRMPRGPGCYVERGLPDDEADAGIDAVKPLYASNGQLRGVLDVTLTLTAMDAPEKHSSDGAQRGVHPGPLRDARGGIHRGEPLRHEWPSS